MMKTFYYITLLLVFVSCTKTKEIKITEPPKELITNVVQEIDGDLGGFIYAKNERIKITFKKNEDKSLPGFEIEIPVKLVFYNASEIKAGRGYNNYGPNLKVEFLDKDGRVLDILNTHLKGQYSDLADYIKAGNEREEWVDFDGRYIVNSFSEDNSLVESRELIDKFSKVASIRLKSEIIEERFAEENKAGFTDSGDNSTPFTENNKKDSKKSNKDKCDKFLDDYEDAVMTYVKMAKKAQQNPNNLSYMTEMAEYVEKISKIEGNMDDNCKNDAKVAKRLVELQMKMAQALQ